MCVPAIRSRLSYLPYLLSCSFRRAVSKVEKSGFLKRSFFTYSRFFFLSHHTLPLNHGCWASSHCYCLLAYYPAGLCIAPASSSVFAFVSQSPPSSQSCTSANVVTVHLSLVASDAAATVSARTNFIIHRYSSFTFCNSNNCNSVSHLSTLHRVSQLTHIEKISLLRYHQE